MKSLSLATPHLLIMTGIPGSGKSFFANKFSDMFASPVLSYHQLTALIHEPAEARAAADYMLEELFKSHQSIIIEGRSDTKRDRVELSRLAREHGYEPLFIWVQTDVATARSRAARPSKAKTNRILDATEHDKLVKKFTPLTGIEKHVVISGKHTYATQARVVLARLSAPRATQTHQSRPPERPDAPNDSGRRSITIG